MKYGDAFINSFQERLEYAISSITDPALKEATRYALLPAGKCLRPFLFAQWYYFANRNGSLPWDVAVSIELIHTASIIHDDIIDSGLMRRGRPSLVQAVGLPMAVLTGDTLIFQAMSLNYRLPEVTRYMSEIGTSLCNGVSTELTLSSQKYFVCIEQKTAVFFKNICLMAVTLANRLDLAEVAAEFGTVIGLLYQIQDDIVDDDLSIESHSKRLKHERWKVHQRLQDRLTTICEQHRFPLSPWNKLVGVTAVPSLE